VPAEKPEFFAERKFYLYDIVTTGGTLIHWGAAPHRGPPGESTPEEKRGRLRKFVAEHGPLNTIQSPSILKVRSDLEATPRVAEGPNSAPPHMK
jgi:hypothetical protein